MPYGPALPAKFTRSDPRLPTQGETAPRNSEILPVAVWDRNRFFSLSGTLDMAEAFDLLNEIVTIEAPLWRNLWFLRDGRTYRGPLRFRSERAATAMGDGWSW
jgi:hypothetical protein